MKVNFIIIFITIICLLYGCNTQPPAPGGNINAFTPVTATHIMRGDLTDTVVLNATSAFLLKTSVKAAINGYLKDVNISLGSRVEKAQVLFTMKSKEAGSIGNIITDIDTSLHFSGISEIRSPGNGFVTQLDFSSGDYVQEGETLAAISDNNSLVFLLYLPYELNPYLAGNRNVILSLPDGQKIPASLSISLPFVDPGSQTQNYIIRMKSYHPVPENLVAKVKFIKETKANVVSLPKAAILTNEQQTDFWIMKMTDSTTAVRMPVVKGMETQGRVEIVSPVLTEKDIILLTGNYGLPDTARVIIERGH